MNTLLLIDDRPDNIKSLMDFLTKSGFKVLIAKDGQDGIKTAEIGNPDLILLDVIMPDMNGFEVCKILKSQDNTKHIPIIFLTVRTELFDIVAGFEMGAADYITKPLQYEEVLARVTTHLKLHQLQQQLEQQNQELTGEINRRRQAEVALQQEQNTLRQRTAELHKMNQELAYMTKLKDEFLANISHELRSPLHAILTVTESFLDQVYGTINAKQHKFLRLLENSAQHLLELINEILDLSQINANKLTLHFAPTEVQEICQTCIHLVRELASQKKLKLTIESDFAVNTIQADARRLKQILVNLLTNAIKFTPEQGEVKLEIQGDEEAKIVHFGVRDTGIGIPIEYLNRIFDAFVQLDGGLNRAQEGSGLGLSLVYRLTEMHGGSVQVTSEVNKGSYFIISLPWQPEVTTESVKKVTEEYQQADAVLDSKGYIANSNKVILIVDDQEVSLQILTESLRSQGYQIFTAQNGLEAIQQAELQHPNLIVMDLQMPVMNGLEAIKKIRTHSTINTIPIIGLTALAMPGDRERCLAAGANDYFSKPASLKKLTQAIENWCQ
jgi:signal transduction histidine kinase